LRVASGRPDASSVPQGWISATLATGVACAGGLLTAVAPTLSIAAILSGFGVVLAAVSPAIPLGLSDAPNLVIGLLGHNPFGSGVVRIALFAWIALSVLIARTRESAMSLVSLVSRLPVVCSLLIACVLFLRLPGSLDASYGLLKASDFVAINLTFMIAAAFVAARGQSFHLYVTCTAGVAVLAALLLIKGLHAGTLAPTVGGRFSIQDQEHPIELGRDAAIGIIVCLYLFLGSSAVFAKRFVAIPAIAVLAVSLLASGSRGPLLACAIGGVILLVASSRVRFSRRRLFVLPAICILPALLVPRLVPQADVVRALQAVTGLDVSSNGRTGLWHEAWATFLHHPLLGIGTGSFGAIDPARLYPHNVFLEVGAELGVVALALLVVAICSAASLIWSGWRLAVGQQAMLRWGLIAALFLMALLNACLSGDVRVNSALWVAMGLAVGAAEAERVNARSR
jgi:O-antigen ligase